MNTHNLKSKTSKVLKNIEKLDSQLSESNPIKLWHVHYYKKEMSNFEMHNSIEVGIVLSGSVTRHYTNYKIRLGPGQLWLAGLWEPHREEVFQTPCELIVFVIWPQFLTNIQIDSSINYNWLTPFLAPPNMRPNGTTEQSEQIISFAKRLLLEYESLSALRILKFKLVLLEFLLTIMNNLTQPQENMIVKQNTISRAGKAMEMVLNARAPITSQQAAKKCGLSRNVFGNLFEKTMGISFAQFELRHRLGEAVKDLVKTDAPLKTIAFRWGFTDASHFSHCFVQYYQCTPGKYRELHAG